MGKFVCMVSFGGFEIIAPCIFNSGSRRS